METNNLTEEQVHTTPPVQEPPLIPTSKPHQAFGKHKKIWSLIPVLLVLIFGMGAMMLSLQKSQDVRSRAAITGTTLALIPKNKTVKIGETVSLGVTMNTNTDSVAAVQLHLSYDPTAIQILSFTNGTVLPKILTRESHANGTMSVALGSQLSSPFKGAGVIGTWTVKILAAKNSSVQFTSSTQVAAVGKTTNALASSTGSTITGIAAKKTPTPTTKKTPTPTLPPIPKKISTATPTPTTKRTPTPTTKKLPTPTPTPCKSTSTFHCSL